MSEEYGIMDVIKDELSGKADYVDIETYNARIAICEPCPHLVHTIPGTGGNCKLCWCFVAQKAKHKKSQCPDDPPRWLAVKK